jgi:glutamate-1-semialdehyde 2,1-aminomutase
MTTAKSQSLFLEAQKHLVGGVNSPVRAFKSVGGQPLFISKGKGAYIYDADGNEYIDYVGSYGPLILGHAHPAVQKAIIKALENGTCFGASSEGEIELAKLVKEAFPSIEMLRFVNSGTEAVMSAIRLARAFTKREKIVKFSGCYHGHSDFLLAEAGSGLMTYGLPASAGVPQKTVQDTLIAPYNDIQFLEELFKKFPEEVAAVIIEPVVGNMGVVLPNENYLAELRELTSRYGILLIFDEVMTGFRKHFGGVQGIYDINPDITCLGKVIGGGMPVGAYGARREIMEMVAPLGPVYQAGTLSGNPIAMAAGIATLNELKIPGLYTAINDNTNQLARGIEKLAAAKNIPMQVAVYGSMITPFFTSEKVTDYTRAKKADTVRFSKFFNLLIEYGIFPPPSQFEAWFVSIAHTGEDIDTTLRIFEQVLERL